MGGKSRRMSVVGIVCGSLAVVVVAVVLVGVLVLSPPFVPGASSSTGPRLPSQSGDNQAGVRADWGQAVAEREIGLAPL